MNPPRFLRLRRAAAIFLPLLLASCAVAPPQHPSARGPKFEPEKFFAGQTRSTGVFENRVGPRFQYFKTEATGQLEGNTLKLAQHFIYEDGHTQDRHWIIRRIDEHHYEGTANDVVGRAEGETIGNTFRFSYQVALKPGNSLSNVRLNQVMTLRRNGTVENRATISKLGITVSHVRERFRKVK